MAWHAKWQMLNPRAYICYLFVPINRPAIRHQHLFSGLTDATISYSFWMAACLARGPSARRLQQRELPFMFAVFLVASQMRRGNARNPVEFGEHSLEQVSPACCSAGTATYHTCMANTVFRWEVALWFCWTKSCLIHFCSATAYVF